MIIKQKIFNELSARNIRINTSIIAKITKIKNKINNKIIDEFFIYDIKIANEFITHLFEVNAFFTAKLNTHVSEINNNFTVKIEKIKICISSFSLKANRFLVLLNIITNKLSEAEKTLKRYHNNFYEISSEFILIKTSIEILQNNLA